MEDESGASDLVAGFADLIAPTSTEEFFARHWERTFLHVPHAPEEFLGYFSLRDVGKWVSSTRSGVVFTLLPDAEGVRLDIRRAQELAPRVIADNFRRGFAQIFKKMADWPALQGLVDHLGKVFHADVQVNAFLTPAGARTYPTYTASNDIFVLQLEGDEVWRLHEFSVLQLDLPGKKDFEFPAEWEGRTETPVLAEVHLQPGDLLFIPRGMPHFVNAPVRTGLHLRIYVTSLSWMDFLKIAVEYAALHSQELRKSLPPGFVGSPAICDRMRSTFEQVLDAFQEQVRFDGVLGAVERNRVRAQGFPAEGSFDEIAGAEELTDDSEVERRPDVLCTVDDVVDSAGRCRSTIFFGDGHLSGPPHLLRALEFIRDRSRFRVSEIPGLDAKSQRVLVGRLVAEGLLRPRLGT